MCCVNLPPAFRAGRHISSLEFVVYQPDPPRLCVVTDMLEYVKRTSTFRQGAFQLLLSYKKLNNPNSTIKRDLPLHYPFISVFLSGHAKREDTSTPHIVITKNALPMGRTILIGYLKKRNITFPR